MTVIQNRSIPDKKDCAAHDSVSIVKKSVHPEALKSLEPLFWYFKRVCESETNFPGFRCGKGGAVIRRRPFMMKRLTARSNLLAKDESNRNCTLDLIHHSNTVETVHSNVMDSTKAVTHSIQPVTLENCRNVVTCNKGVFRIHQRLLFASVFLLSCLCTFGSSANNEAFTASSHRHSRDSRMNRPRKQLHSIIVPPSDTTHRELAVNNTMTDGNIQYAAYLWVTNYAAALAKYGNIRFWDTSRVTDMTDVFGYYNPYAGSGNGAYWANNFAGNISAWDTSRVTSMYDMFDSAISFNGDLSKWNTSKVVNMEFMFWFAANFNGNVSTWDTSKVTSMYAMFQEAQLFNGDVSKWNTGSLTNMDQMFLMAYSFNGDVSKWSTSKVTTMDSSFMLASAFNRDISKWVTSGVTNMQYMFSSTNEFNSAITKWDTSRVVNMAYMFNYSVSFKQVLCWNTAKVTSSKTQMFTGSMGSFSTKAYPSCLNVPSGKPSKRPTKKPTFKRTGRPSKKPSKLPTKQPVKKPTMRPTKKPTKRPTKKPTKLPTKKPTKRPTKKPTKRPTKKPSVKK